jgi:hypothetical protein
LAKQSVSATATDNAGNTASANLKLNIDKTPPTITATASLAPNAKGWNNSNVTVTGVSEVDQINRGQSRSNHAFGSQPNARQFQQREPCSILSRHGSI